MLSLNVVLTCPMHSSIIVTVKEVPSSALELTLLLSRQTSAPCLLLQSYYQLGVTGML